METFRFWNRNEEGATAVEYGIMVALIAIVIIGAVTFLGGSLKDSFCETADAIDSVNADGGTALPGDCPQ